MAIISSINSFVNFNEELLTCTGQTRQAPLPAYDNFGIKFQFSVDDILPTSTVFKAAICTEACELLLNPDYEVIPFCQRLLLIDENGNPLTVEQFPVTFVGGPNAGITANTVSELVAIINATNDTGIPGIDFIYCCEAPEIDPFTLNTTGEVENLTYSLESRYASAWVNFPAIDMDGIVEGDQCFRYCILNEANEVQACSNLFKRTLNDCYTTLFRYYNEGSSFGFRYEVVEDGGENVRTENTIRLYINFRNPEPANLVEDTFRAPNGKYIRVNTLYDWEYLAEVAPLSAEQYRQLVAMLKHDFVFATDIDAGVDGQITQLGAIEILYPDNIRNTVNPAQFRIIDHRSNDVNNNCGSDCGTEVIDDCEGGGVVIPCPDKYFIEFQVPGPEMAVDQTTYTNPTLATLNDVLVFREGLLQYPFGSGYTATFTGGTVTFNPGVQDSERIAIWEA